MNLIYLMRGITVSYLLLKRLHCRDAVARRRRKSPARLFDFLGNATVGTTRQRHTDTIKEQSRWRVVASGRVTLSTSCYSRSSAGTGRSWGKPVPVISDSHSSLRCDISLWLPPECQTPEHERKSTWVCEVHTKLPRYNVKLPRFLREWSVKLLHDHFQVITWNYHKMSGTFSHKDVKIITK